MPASRSDATVAPSARFESFLPSGPRIRPWCTYSGAVAPGDIPRRVGVVDPEQEPIAEPSVRDRGQRVADVEGTGRARRKTDAAHRRRTLPRAAAAGARKLREISLRSPLAGPGRAPYCP